MKNTLYSLIIFLSYLIGSVPFALIIGKLFYNTDIRNHGSGNLGATNSFRVLGKKAGFVVAILDILKGTLAASFPFWLNVDIHPIISGIPAVIGHSYPLFANFKGGKAVATSAGIFIFASPIAFLIGLITFFLNLKLTKFVSLSSIISILSISLYTFFSDDIFLFYFSLLLSFIIIYRHIENLKRISNKTEPKISWL